MEYASLYHKKNEGENVISANLGPLFVTMTNMPFFYGADKFLQQGKVHTYLGNYGSILLSKWVQLECFTIDTAIGR